MATYTIELRKVCEIYGRDKVEEWFKSYNLNDYLSESQINEITSYNVWSKDKLAKKIVDHYFMREIGFETPALFEHYAKVTMQEIMEKYLPIIYTNCIEYDPFESVDFHIEERREIEGSTTGNTEGANHSTSTSDNTSISNNSDFNVNSDTPQTNIDKNSLLSGTYATSTNATNSDNTTNSNTTIEDSTTNTSNSNASSKQFETFYHDESGNKGVLDSYQKMIMQLRQTFNDTDSQIIKELNILFMGLY